MESNGKLLLPKKADHRPVTPHDLRLPASSAGLPRALIVEGKLRAEKLETAGLTRESLF
ncbi:MAG: YetF domain-containing protein [Bacillota bacterium]